MQGRPNDSSIQGLLNLFNAAQHRVKRWHVTEHHACHGRVISPECFSHVGRWGQCEGAMSCRDQAQIGAAKKQPGMPRAVGGQGMVAQPLTGLFVAQELMDIVVMGVSSFSVQ